MIMDPYGIDPDFQTNFNVLVVYTLHDLLEATYGFVSTISPRRSIPLYGRGIDERLRFQQDYRSRRKANDTVF
jgi:hypothetical protein